MDWVVLFCCIGAGELEDDFAAARMFGDEACYIVDVAVQDYPATLCRVVLCDCCAVSVSSERAEEVVANLPRSHTPSPFRIGFMYNS